MGYREKVVVIGAGISGLACAFALKQSGVLPLVLEAGERAGGVIRTVRRNGFVFETGPQCPRFPASVWRLLRELNLESEFVAGDPKAKRYILRNGRLHPAPFTPTGLVTTGLLGLRSKLRILGEPLGKSHPPANEESLAEFVQRKFGKEVLDNLVDPLISTIFFGDAYKMGMDSAFPALVEWERTHGSLMRGALHARKVKRQRRVPDDAPGQAIAGGQSASLRVTDSLPSLGSMRAGMAEITERLADELKTEMTYKAEAFYLAPVPDGSVGKVHWQIALAGGQSIETDHVVVALPAYTAAQIMSEKLPDLAQRLRGIEYAPVCAVSSAYDRAAVKNRLDGFGFMVPRREKMETICTFWNSSLFPQRAPEGKVLMTSFAGREGNGDFARKSDEQWAREIEAENARILGITSASTERVVWKEARALPQYNVGHARIVGEIYDILRRLPQLHVIGNYLKGRSIGDCVDLAFRAAHEVHSQIRG